MGFVTRLFDSLTQRGVLSGAHPSTHGEWSLFGAGMRSHSGVDVTVEGSFALPAVYACVQVISQDVAKLPLITYRRLKRGKERAIDYPGYRLLKESPNPEMTSLEWREFAISHVASWGNGYSEIEWRNDGTVVGLWPLRPDRMRVKRRNGKLRYLYTLPNGKEEDMPAWRIHHTRGLGFDGVVGWSPVRMAMQAIGLGLAAEEYGARWYAGGGQPRVVAIHPGKLTQGAQDRISTSLEGSMTGLSNSHRIKVLEEGLKLEKVGVPAEEAQFLETQDFQAHQIARLYRMPPHKIGLLKNATFSNIEHQAIEYVTDTLQPWLVRHEQALSRDLLTSDEQQSLFFEYLVEGALRGDIQSRYAAYAVGRQWGWFSANDIRERENLNPIEGGDSYLTPLNMVDAVSKTPLDPAKKGQSRHLQPLYEDALGRLARREAADLRRGVEKYLRKQGVDAFRGWLDEFYRDLTPVVREMLAPVVIAHGEAGGADRRLVDRYVAGYAAQYVLAQRQMIESDLSDEQIEMALTRRCQAVESAAGDLALRLAVEVEQLCN